MKTRIHYIYADASNWKFRGSFVIDGEISIEQLKPYLLDEAYFVPSEVGLSHLLSAPINRDDHYLHSFEVLEQTDEGEPTITSDRLIQRFKTAAERGWFRSLI